MKKETEQKYQALRDLLAGMGSVAVAYSGGVDSSFLLYVANDVLRDKALAITVKSPYIPDWEFAEAKEFTAHHSIRHSIVNADIPASVVNNPPDRCYLCKKIIFAKLLEVTHKENMQWLAEGTNHDDLGDYRPGLKALAELNVRSPLKDCGFKKNEIREVSKELGLNTWDKPAYACLLTRIPYNTKVDIKTLKRIELAEKFIIDLGIRDVRVRDHGDVARIETGVHNFEKILKNGLNQTITEKLKELGYSFVTLDLGGYKMGSFNS